MIRISLAGLLTLALAGCAAPGPDAVPEPNFVIGEGLDQVYAARWSPDGSRLAYTKIVEGRAAIFVADADGGNPVRLTEGVWDTNPIWSPDGLWIAYYSDEEADIYLVSAAGGERRQLTSGPGQDATGGWLPDGSAVVVERAQGGTVQTLFVPVDGGAPRTAAMMEGASVRASPSPDGSQLLMQVERAGSMTIWLRALPDGEPRQLTTEGFEDPQTSTAWSPDGRFILYESRRTGTSDLWVLEAATGEARQLTNDVRDDFGGRWSPDGQWVAFRSTRGGQEDLWVVPAAGGNATRLTNSPAVEIDPRWAPDGASVSFELADARASVGLLATDGSEPRTLVQWEGQEIFGARPSPDGTRVLFSGSRGGNFDLMVVPVAGGEPAILAAGPAFEGEGAWSSDGAQVAFVSSRGGTRDLWLVSSAGGEARQLTDWTPAVELAPKWSPDGSTIAFQSNREAGVLELWTIPATGGVATRLAPGLEVEGFNWAPDGRTLYADAVAAGGARGIYAVPATGGAPRALLEGDVDVAWPQPSPDGTQIAYIRFGAGWGHLEAVPATGGTPRRLTTRADHVYHTNPRWAPDGSAIVVEDFVFPTSGQELEVVSWPGGEWRRLQAVPDRFMLNPEWMPDNRSLIYTEFDGSRRVVVLPVTSILEARR